MRIRRASVALLLALAACGGASSSALRSPDVEGFDPADLIDVLGPDQIRSLDEPRFEPAAAANWLADDHPVVAVAVGDEAKAYPLGILTRHEIVNDELAGTPVAVTYCPLCNSAVVYDRGTFTINGEARALTLEFGVSGKLYHSDLVMFDRKTDSLWPQIMGRAVLGELKGAELRRIPSSIVAWRDFRVAHPEGIVLARPIEADYAFNPYEGYDSREGPYEDFAPAVEDDRVPALQRVVGIAVEDEARAYPYVTLKARGNPAVVHDRLGGTDLVIFWGGGARSALDDVDIESGARVGGSAVFAPRAGDRALRFDVRDGHIVDAETGSTWSLLGRATAGPLKGASLEQVNHLDAFWFAWAAFVPHTEVWDG